MNNLDNDMSAPSILITYRGGVTAEVVDSLLTLVLHRLENIEDNINVRKRVYSVLMECSQNLTLHATRSGAAEKDTSNAYLSLESNQTGYDITSANLVENERLKNLINNLDNINHQKTPDDLKKLYNQIITNDKYSEKGGGGLGLIDVARKSSGKLNYSYNMVNDEYSFFTLNVAIKK
jgi:hypothetical protein